MVEINEFGSRKPKKILNGQHRNFILQINSTTQTNIIYMFVSRKNFDPR